MAAKHGAREQSACLHHSARQYARGVVPPAAGELWGVEAGAGNWGEEGGCVWRGNSPGAAELWWWSARHAEGGYGAVSGGTDPSTFARGAQLRRDCPHSGAADFDGSLHGGEPD